MKRILVALCFLGAASGYSAIEAAAASSVLSAVISDFRTAYEEAVKEREVRRPAEKNVAFGFRMDECRLRAIRKCMDAKLTSAAIRATIMGLKEDGKADWNDFLDGFMKELIAYESAR